MSLFPNRYNLTNLLKVVTNPSMVRGELSRVGVNTNVRLHQWLHDDQDDCVAVMERDWDNLLILDACRYDVFAEENEIEGDFEAVISCGSHTVEFLRANFEGQTFHDTVYVTANPNAHKLESQTFHATIPLYSDENWDSEIMTVPPDTVVEAAIDAHEQYPSKRLVVHFIQPHTPFIGEKGRQIPQKHTPPGEDPEPDQEIRWIWGNLQYNLVDIDIDTIREAYRENVSIALEQAERLVEALPGKSVVTADHGNLIGDRTGPIPVRGYGHPEGLRHRHLVEVPWLVVETGSRREIVSESPQQEGEISQETIEKQLRALGYQ